jgi:hypothetical protein
MMPGNLNGISVARASEISSQKKHETGRGKIRTGNDILPAGRPTERHHDFLTFVVPRNKAVRPAAIDLLGGGMRHICTG